jgi:succinate-semialdehyde dehydrogenase/glutarate-semialdehyde dehydrogenase
MSAPERLTPINPATGVPLAPVAVTTAGELEAVVARARAAQTAWAALPFDDRAAHVREFAAALGAEADALAGQVTDEMGKPIREARAEVRSIAARVESFVTAARQAVADEEGVENAIRVRVRWRPLGVVAVIAPWNYPVATPCNLLLSALLTGNAAVFKPSEYTPHTGARLHAIFARTLPEGLVGLVQGTGTVGASLVAATGVDMVAFTGSIAAGQAIMRSAAATMKRLVLELGGKDPMLVLPGADVEAAARHAAAEALRNSGQVCVSVERVIVHKDLAERFTSRVAELVRAVTPGDPRDEACQMGPLSSARQRDLVLAQIADARERGARFVVEGEARGPGFYLTPSVVTDLKPDMALVKDETFGPVVAIHVAGDTDAAVAMANATHYGLGASVWGAPGPELDAIADKIEAGMVGVNRGLSTAAGGPWVGWKMSGLGYTRSAAGMRQFLQPQSQARRA